MKMFRRFVAVFVVVLLLAGVAVPSVAESKKTFDVNITSYSLLYKMVMEQLGQTTTMTRTWDTDKQAQIRLNDICFCALEVTSKSDLANIESVLHTACLETQKDYQVACMSMLTTIAIFDPDLPTDTAFDLVLNVLPEKSTYTSDECEYKYMNINNVYMLLITPR